VPAKNLGWREERTARKGKESHTTLGHRRDGRKETGEKTRFKARSRETQKKKWVDQKKTRQSLGGRRGKKLIRETGVIKRIVEEIWVEKRGGQVLVVFTRG